MKTPIYDFITEYGRSEFSRLHMPGHKGEEFLGVESRDLTEIKGADELYDAEGIIAESESNATELFGTGATLYSTEGSSHVIKAMLYLAVLRYRKRKTGEISARPVILAARNVHKSFVFGCALMDIDPQWIYPENSDLSSICTCQPDAVQTERQLNELLDKDILPAAVYITSPDYLGYEADVRRISETVKKCCTEHGYAEDEIPLLVDNAHGAYLHFLKEKRHPIDLGAYMCSDSAHKTLPVITGGAYLQMSDAAVEELLHEAKNALSIFGSTSPSYLIMQSLDLCNRYIDDGYEKRLEDTIRRVEDLKREINEMVTAEKDKYIIDTEPLKIVVNASLTGNTGNELGEKLRQYKIEPEFTDVNYAVLMLTPENTDRDLERIKAALLSAVQGKPGIISEKTEAIRLVPLEKVMTVREAIFSTHEEIETDRAEGRICGQTTVSCPPAIPIAVSGERIDRKSIELFRAYGINTISVVI